MSRGPPGSGDPLVKARLRLRFRGLDVTLLAPHSVFSSARIDEGTRLLLDLLPPGEPGSFLDLGCGYGAIGVPLAAALPRARGILADRDLLAVEFARRNAAHARAGNIEIAASLGYAGLPPGSGPFDWILFNAPARAGARAIAALISGGRARLRPGGELRVVVIGPLAEMVRGLEGAGIAGSSATHAVFAFPPGPGVDPAEDDYLRDRVELRLPGALVLERPTDLADEPHRLPDAIPLLAGALPAEAPRRALAWRAGYGLVPALLASRYPDAAIDAVDRDLLATAFARRNCAVAGRRVSVMESLGLEAVRGRPPYDLVTGEILSPLGPRATIAELEEACRVLAPGGTGLVLGLYKHWDEFIRRASRRLGISIAGRRGPAALFRIDPGSGEGPAGSAAGRGLTSGPGASPGPASPPAAGSRRP